MKDTDILFQDVLEYLYRNLSGKKAEENVCSSEKPYGILWEQGLRFMDAGFSEDAIQIALEYEKAKIIRDRELSEEELLQLLVMERMIRCIHTGEYGKTASIVQAFASQELLAKYGFVLNLLYQMEDTEQDRKETFCLEHDIPQTCRNQSNSRMQEFFTAINTLYSSLLEKEKINMVRNMLRHKVPDLTIREIAGISEEYLQIIKNGIKNQWDKNTIYAGIAGILKNENKKTGYKDLSTDEALLYQTIAFYAGKWF